MGKKSALMSVEPRYNHNTPENINHNSTLSVRHQVFVTEYITNGGNATQAYIAARPNVKYNTAMTESCKLLRNPKITEAIQTEFARLFKEKDKEFRKGELYQQIVSIGNSDIGDIIDIKGDTVRIKDLSSLTPSVRKSIKSIKVTRKETEKGVQFVHEVVLHDKMKALELQSKILRLVNNDPVEVDIIIRPAQRPLHPRPRRDAIQVEAVTKECEG